MTFGILTNIGNYQLYILTAIADSLTTHFPTSVTNSVILEIGIQPSRSMNSYVTIVYNPSCH